MVTVTDPMHPLYGRRFEVLSVSRAAWGEGPRHVAVRYKANYMIRIPLPATNLDVCQPSGGGGKFTEAALAELISVATEATQACRSRPIKSGKGSRKSSGRRPLPASKPSSGR